MNCQSSAVSAEQVPLPVATPVLYKPKPVVVSANGQNETTIVRTHGTFVETDIPQAVPIEHMQAKYECCLLL